MNSKNRRRVVGRGLKDGKRWGFEAWCGMGIVYKAGDIKLKYIVVPKFPEGERYNNRGASNQLTNQPIN